MKLQYILIKIVGLLLSGLLLNGCVETRPQQTTAPDLEAPKSNARTRLVPPLVVVKTRTTQIRPAPKAKRSIEFTDQDRRIILQYYKSINNRIQANQLKRASHTQLAQLKKSGQWSNKLKEKNLPFALETKLSHLAHGYVRKQIGHHLLIRNLNTDEIVDFIMDIAY